MLPIFFMVWRPPRATVVQLAGAYIMGTVFSVGWGLLHGPVAGDARYVGYTYHPNFLGIECLLAAALVPFVVGSISFNWRWVYWGAGLICAYGIWLSGSRAALLVLGMLVFVYPFVERSIKAAGAVVFGLAVVLALSNRLVQEDSNNALGRLFGGGTANGSDIERKRILTTALDQFKSHPILGVGFDGGLGSHNIYLQVATAVGILGLIGYLLVLWAALRPLFWTGINHRLAYPALAYMAIGPLTNTLWDRMIWAVLALTLAVNTRRPPEPESSTIDGGTSQRALAEMRNSQ
jgi:O-antigen ligase